MRAQSKAIVGCAPGSSPTTNIRLSLGRATGLAHKGHREWRGARPASAKHNCSLAATPPQRSGESNSAYPAARTQNPLPAPSRVQRGSAMLSTVNNRPHTSAAGSLLRPHTTPEKPSFLPPPTPCPPLPRQTAYRENLARRHKVGRQPAGLFPCPHHKAPCAGQRTSASR